MDAGTVYLELEPRVWNVGEPAARLSAVRIHWKDGARWQKLRIVGNDGEDIGSLLIRLGTVVSLKPDARPFELAAALREVWAHA